MREKRRQYFGRRSKGVNGKSGYIRYASIRLERVCVRDFNFYPRFEETVDQQHWRKPVSCSALNIHCSAITDWREMMQQPEHSHCFGKH